MTHHSPVRWMIPVLASCALGCSNSSEGGLPGTASSGGASPSAGGSVNTPSNGGANSPTGGTNAQTGSTAQGGTNAQTGGVNAQTGGAATQTGGATTQTGGVGTQTGGASTENGGATTGTGGASTENGGATTGTGGKATGGTTVTGCSTTCTATAAASATETPPLGTFCDDRDGQIYDCVIIGGQTWMAENLNYGTYVALNSSTSATIESRVQADDAVDERWCWKNDVSLCLVWGGLYQWAEAMALPSSCNAEAGCTLNSPHRGICPNGWHIPTQSEWRTLLSFAESFDATIGAGDVLKSASLDYWQVEGYNTLNWNCLGAGGVYPSTPGGFGDRLRFANIWGAGEGTTASESDSTVILQSGTCFRTRGCNDATYCSAKGSSSGAVGAACAKRDGSSVRCVAD